MKHVESNQPLHCGSKVLAKAKRALQYPQTVKVVTNKTLQLTQGQSFINKAQDSKPTVLAMHPYKAHLQQKQPQRRITDFRHARSHDINPDYYIRSKKAVQPNPLASLVRTRRLEAMAASHLLHPQWVDSAVRRSRQWIEPRFDTALLMQKPRLTAALATVGFAFFILLSKKDKPNVENAASNQRKMAPTLISGNQEEGSGGKKSSMQTTFSTSTDNYTAARIKRNPSAGNNEGLESVQQNLQSNALAQADLWSSATLISREQQKPSLTTDMKPAENLDSSTQPLVASISDAIWASCCAPWWSRKPDETKIGKNLKGERPMQGIPQISQVNDGECQPVTSPLQERESKPEASHLGPMNLNTLGLGVNAHDEIYVLNGGTSNGKTQRSIPHSTIENGLSSRKLANDETSQDHSEYNVSFSKSLYPSETYQHNGERRFFTGIVSGPGNSTHSASLYEQVSQKLGLETLLSWRNRFPHTPSLSSAAATITDRCVSGARAVLSTPWSVYRRGAEAPRDPVTLVSLLLVPELCV